MMVSKKIDVVKILEEIDREISKIVVGQKQVIHGLLRAVICDGHVLLEGVPGVAKTVIVRTLASILGCDMKRIQFTVDLLPTDITGIVSYDPKRGFEVLKGPIFANFILADEINRSPPKTQSALLEAMQEGQVTISKKTHDLPKPFFVMATENPLETSGVYTLPEAQLDRFLFKLFVNYPKYEEEKGILNKNATTKAFEEYDIKSVLSPDIIQELQRMAKEVYSSEVIEEYIVKIVEQTRSKDHEYSKYVSYGGSPRASIAIHIASKAEALMNGRDYVTPKDVRAVVYPVLRHRVILNYEADAEKITPDQVIKHILARVGAP
jgi:MoxR-like ATPase